MNFCSACGHKVTLEIPAGDNRPRHVCGECQTIHYQNPKIVAGAVPVYGSKILLCKRAIEPRLGYWTLPAGFMENGETTAQAAIRETWEEAQAKVTLDGLYTIIDIPHINQVHMFFRAQLLEGKFGVGEESLEVELFAEADIPWDEIAFPTVKQTLQHFIEDARSGEFGIYTKDIQPRDRLRL